ncbi:MAG: diguanylate cyclase (GGDEF)-like protein [Gammaproteobacteria bacterium]
MILSQTQSMNLDVTILIVDDEMPIRHLMSLLLKDFGTIEMAGSGKEALEKVNALTPDLIILDVQMPEMNGYEVCQKIKANDKTSSIPIVFLTANSSNEDEEYGFEIGATDFIRKPISPKIVSARVSNILSLQLTTRKLELIASTDPLTGAFNRRHLNLVGTNELSRSRRYNSTFTLLMLDIDHFKAVNDTYGHDVGDEALIETVAVIKNTIRSEDFLFRLGGEEFAVMLPETAKLAAFDTAERIRIAISKIVIQTPIDPLSFTISIGIAENTSEDNGIDLILKRADEALYQAKLSGRNRVI